MSANWIVLGLSSFVVIAAVSSANAQSLPPEGPFAVTFTATQIPPAKPMTIGANQEYTALNYAMTGSNDAGNPILNNMGGRCLFTRLTDTSAKTVEQHGYCTYVDNDGDQIFEKCDSVPGSATGCKLTGGTG